jgi:hypothetical protein
MTAQDAIGRALTAAATIAAFAIALWPAVF